MHKLIIIKFIIIRGVGSMGAMGAWAPINISSGIPNGCQHTVRDTLIEQSMTLIKQSHLRLFFLGLQLYH